MPHARCQMMILIICSHCHSSCFTELENLNLLLHLRFRQRAQDMWNRIYELESEKFDFMEHMKHQKYEVQK